MASAFCKDLGRVQVSVRQAWNFPLLFLNAIVEKLLSFYAKNYASEELKRTKEWKLF